MLKQFMSKTVKRIMYGSRADTRHYVSYLRRIGISVGDGTFFAEPVSTVIDVAYPALLKIGSNVK